MSRFFLNRSPLLSSTVWAVVALAALVLLGGCDKPPPAEEMALVAAGEFRMGSDSGESDEAPLRKVTLEPFYIDRFEVTNEKYRTFTKETGRAEPKNWLVYGYKKKEKDHPVVFVSFEDATEYCKSVGRRLPTEAEWEKAARGTDARSYPWGMEFKRGVSNTSITGLVGTTPVGKYEGGKSPYGAYDMSGNVWEWTTTDFNEKTKVVKGGSWGLTHRFATTSFRVGYNPTNTAVNNVGFRCARDK